jgi:CheY-like chemotaxis protein
VPQPTDDGLDRLDLPTGRPLTILVVDDAPFDLKIAGRLLAKLGHRVDLASSGGEAVGAVGVLPYDLVFLDLLMPDLDGFGTLARIRALPLPEGRVPVVALTSNVTAGIVERCREAGFDGYLSKPLVLANLRDSLSRHARGDIVRVEAQDALHQLIELLGMSAVEELVADFLAAVPQRLAAAETAATQGDLPALRTAAHQLAGTAAYLGLAAVVGAAGSIESACDARAVEDARLGVTRLQQVVAESGQALHRRFPNLAAPFPAAI